MVTARIATTSPTTARTNDPGTSNELDFSRFTAPNIRTTSICLIPGDHRVSGLLSPIFFNAGWSEIPASRREGDSPDPKIEANLHDRLY